MKVEFHIPVFNEEAILEKNIELLYCFLKKSNFNFDWSIVITINGSTDKSFDIAKKLEKNNPGFIFAKKIEARGKGRAIIESINSSQANIAVYMDVDLAVSLDNLQELVSQIIEEKNDLCFGSRLHKESITDRTYIRELSSRIYLFLSRKLLNHSFSDLQCGFKAFRVQKFQAISPHIQCQNWFFDTELIIFAKEKNYKIKEIPVNWSENRYDKRKSKINLLKESFVFLRNLLDLRKRVRQKKAQKAL